MNKLITFITYLKSSAITYVLGVYAYYKKHLAFILIVTILHGIYLFIFQLAYFNWFRHEAILLLLLIDYFVFIRRLELSVKTFLIACAMIYSIGFIFSIVGINQLAEFTGIIVYGLLLIVIVREIQKMRYEISHDKKLMQYKNGKK